MKMKEVIDLIKSKVPPDYEFEIYWERKKKLKIETSEEDIENLSTSTESGLSLRVLKDDRVGFSYASDLKDETLSKLVKDAIDMCNAQVSDRGNRLMEELKKSSADSVFDKEGVGRSLEEKIEFAINLEKEAKKQDKRIKSVRKSSLSESQVEVVFYNSYGVEYSYEATFYSGMIAAVAEEGGDSSISYEFRGSRRFSELEPEDIARDAVFKAVSLLNPSTLETSVMPVVLFRDSSAMLLSAFAQMFLGDSLVKRKTLLKDKEGESIASELLTIIDDGTLEGGFSTFPYDGEGVPQKRNEVISKGVFKGFLHSLYTATLSDKEPTGNGERNGFRSLPTSGFTNLYIEKGETSFEDLLSTHKKVFLVLELMGLHTVDPVSGEFSLGAGGVIYEGGRPSRAVRGVTIAGNILDLWNKIVAVGNDFKFYGNIGSPSLLAEDITVGGN